MMNLLGRGGDATNRSPNGKTSPEMDRLQRAADLAQPGSPSASDGKNTSFPSKSRRRNSAEADVYKARCSDLERKIVQLKLELAEAKVRVCSLHGGEHLCDVSSHAHNTIHMDS